VAGVWVFDELLGFAALFFAHRKSNWDRCGQNRSCRRICRNVESTAEFSYAFTHTELDQHPPRCGS
jgi:hypothetical protein